MNMVDILEEILIELKRVNEKLNIIVNDIKIIKEKTK